MHNIFEATYKEVCKARTAFDAAQNEAEREEIRGEYDDAISAIDALGAIGVRIWKEYETSRNSGNDNLDINDVVWDKDVEPIVSCMRENGIERFTFSSGWSSAVETAWLFQKNGCTLEGLVEINSQHRNFETWKFEKTHGYLFKVN